MACLPQGPIPASNWTSAFKHVLVWSLTTGAHFSAPSEGDDRQELSVALLRKARVDSSEDSCSVVAFLLKCL